MTTQAADTPVRASVMVEAPQERAFAVFTDGIDTQGGLELFAPMVSPAATAFARSRPRAARGRGRVPGRPRG